MKRNVNTLLFAAAIVFVCLVFSGTNRAAQDSKPASSVVLTPVPRVAVVDIVKVFDTCEQTVVLNKKLAVFTRQFMDRLETQSKAAQAEQDALTAFAVGTAEYYQQQKKARKLALENEVGSQLERDAMAENHKRWLLETYKMITAEIAKAAEAHDVDIVLTREQLNSTDVTDSKALIARMLNIKVVYASSAPSVDLTGEVLANVNAEFVRRGGAASIEFNK